MDFLQLVGAILGSGLLTGVILHFLNKSNTDKIIKVNVDKASAEIRKIERDIEAQYIEQLEKWLRDLRDLQERHEEKILLKEEELVNLHKQHLESIRELDEARLRLEKTSRATQRLMSKANTAYWESDAVGKIIYVNGAWLKLFGLSEEQSLGNRWMSVIQPDELNQAKLLWYSSIVDLNDKPLIINIINPITKEQMALQFIYSNIHDTDGSVSKVIGVVINASIGSNSN